VAVGFTVSYFYPELLGGKDLNEVGGIYPQLPASWIGGGANQIAKSKIFEPALTYLSQNDRCRCYLVCQPLDWHLLPLLGTKPRPK